MSLDKLANIVGLLIAIGFIAYGIAGVVSGKATGSSMAFYTKKEYSGTGARVLASVWILLGLILLAAFGGHMLGIAAVAPLYDFCTQVMSQ